MTRLAFKLGTLTTRFSPFPFLTVRGVLPRNLPGVLNISATFLPVY
jgi:hypothetical protein